MAKGHLSRKLAVIRHADVVGSTTLVQMDEQIAHERIQAAFRGFARSVEAYGGNVTELRRDAFLGEFARGSDAILAALCAQETNERANNKLDDDIRPVLRVGIALGEVVYADDTVTGAGVVLAQHLEQMVQPGGICVSAATREAALTRLPFNYENLGPQEAKGFDHPVHTFAISLREGHPIPPPSKDFTTTRGRGPPEALLLAHESAQKAIELDNSLAEGYGMLARVYSRQRQHDDSVATLEKAVSLNSTRAETYPSLANTLTFAGRPLEAIHAAQKAMRLDPFYGYPGDFYFGRALYFAKQNEEALLPLKTCVARAPKFPACYMYLAPLYAKLGRTEDAGHTVARLLELQPGFTIEASV